MTPHVQILSNLCHFRNTPKVALHPEDTSTPMAPMLSVIPELPISEIPTLPSYNNGNRSSLIYAYSYRLNFPRMHITCHALQSRQLYTEAISLHAIQIVSVSNHDSYNQSAHANCVVMKISPVTSSNTYKPPFSNEIKRRGEKKRIRTRQTGP